MKYIFFIIVAFLLVQEIPAQIRLSTMTEVTSLDTADLFWVNEFVTPNWVNRKLKWLNLRSNMIDYIDGLANTWALKQTYSSGATFSTGSNGTVDIQDSALTTGLWTNWLHARQAVTYIGSTTDPFFNVYSRNFVVVNPYENDSVYISYDDSTLSFNKAVSFPNLSITESVTIDSGATIGMFRLDQLTYNIPDVADTILKIPLASAKSFIILNPPGNVTNLNKFTLEGATIGTIVKIINADAFDTIALKDIVGNDDNLLLSADFTLGFYDSLDLLCVDDSPDAQIWIETARSNN